MIFYMGLSDSWKLTLFIVFYNRILDLLTHLIKLISQFLASTDLKLLEDVNYVIRTIEFLRKVKRRLFLRN